MRSKINNRQFVDLIMKQIGEVEPIGETQEDEQRFDSLYDLEEITWMLFEEIYYCCGYISNYEYSMKRSAEEAIRWMGEKRDWLIDVFGRGDTE